MGKTFETITPELQTWVEAQRLFFVATAPLAADGLVNCSPKGMDTFRVLGPRQVACLDLTGSGIETVAHVHENGRIVFMVCAFEGVPKIVRFHGQAEVITPDHAAWPSLAGHFPALPGARAILRATLDRISDSCGYAVPRYQFVEERDTLIRWAENKGADGLTAYRHETNAASLNQLPGLATG